MIWCPQDYHGDGAGNSTPTQCVGFGFLILQWGCPRPLPPSQYVEISDSLNHHNSTLRPSVHHSLDVSGTSFSISKIHWRETVSAFTTWYSHTSESSAWCTLPHTPPWCNFVSPLPTPNPTPTPTPITNPKCPECACTHIFCHFLFCLCSSSRQRLCDNRTSDDHCSNIHGR